MALTAVFVDADTFTISGTARSQYQEKRGGWNRADLVGQQFGRLVVIIECGRTKDSKVVWECQCSCGQTTKITTGALRSGHIRSCGCLRKEVMSKTKSLDITGMRFGELTAIEPTKQRNKQSVIWRCLCSCGNEHFVCVRSLRSGHTLTCGDRGVHYSGENSPNWGGKLCQSGKDNPNWRCGVTSEHMLVRMSKGMQEWRMSVYERDWFACQLCGYKGADLCAHHIQKFSEYEQGRFDIYNGITLCRDCHLKTYGKEEVFAPMLEDLVLAGYRGEALWH